MAAGDLTTLANVKEWLGIPSSNTQSDALLSRMITAASAFIVSWLEREVLSATYTETRDGNNSQRMKMRNFPITLVTLVKVDNVVIPETERAFNDASIVLRGCRWFSKGILNVEVTYVAGYAVVPPDIEQACIEMIGLRYKDRERIGITSKGLAGETITFSQADMSKSVKTILTEHRRVVPV